MTNVLTFYFKGEDILKLASDIKGSSDYVLITCGLNVAILEGKKVAVMSVQGESYSSDETSTAAGVKSSVQGCPVPPCVRPGKLAEGGCMDEMHELIATASMI